MEGPARVLGACSGAKEAHREVPREPMKLFLGPQGGPISKRDPLATPRRPKRARAEPEQRPRALGKNKGQRFSNSNRSKKKKISDLSRPGPLARRILNVFFVLENKASAGICRLYQKKEPNI